MIDIRNDVEKALADILSYWTNKMPDKVNGGFIGRIDEFGSLDLEAPKGAVLNARILWAFSAAFIHTDKLVYKEMADRAYSYIINHFIDEEFGGVYWTVTSKGKPLETKKQIYALSFTIYALAEYYKITQYEEVLETALKLFNAIEIYSFDKIRGGYFEAFNRDWSQMEDLRLSSKDVNEKKTMNTHLHILEAYTNLYMVSRDEQVYVKIKGLLNSFYKHIINRETMHLNLFMNEEWQVSGSGISYGHDIEASWLLLEAAQLLGEQEVIDQFKELAIRLTEAAVEGLEKDGSLIYEYFPESSKFNKERHWWVQAEALVGFLNAWELTGKQDYFNYFSSCWKFIDQYIVDKEEGEWFWGVNEDLTIMKGEDKAGLWKCPYHNTRACIETLKRLAD
ncbi:AGE family epimerase/isomerase [Pedobacter sp. ASV1-7]|uniref:AGE family epimerase/isomerase n=1 Tax=Pedobacter sp. ASV1-7 TaxID=3145237 RepID=UPI0032E8BB9F